MTQVALGASRRERMDALAIGVTGRLVAAFEEAAAADEKHIFQWNGKDPAGDQLPPGIYFWKVQVGDQVATRKVIMAR